MTCVSAAAGSANITVVSVPPPPTTIVAAGQGLQGPPGPAGAGGSVAQYPAAMDIGGHTVVAMNSTGQLTPGDSQEPQHAIGIVGITLGAVTSGATAQVVWHGPIEHVGWAFTPDFPVYLGPGGQVVQAPPVGLFIKPVGIALSPTRIAVSIQPAIFTTT